MIRKKSPARRNSDNPVTAGQFDEAMAIIATSFEKVVTKEDAKQFATKDDLKHTKEEIFDRMAQDKNEILHHFDAAVENIHSDLVGANQDEISGLITAQEDHEGRIINLERHAGTRV